MPKPARIDVLWLPGAKLMPTCGAKFFQGCCTYAWVKLGFHMENSGVLPVQGGVTESGSTSEHSGVCRSWLARSVSTLQRRSTGSVKLGVTFQVAATQTP